MKILSILIIWITIISCSGVTTDKRYDIHDENYGQNILRKNRVSELNVIESGIDTSGNSMWKRLLVKKRFSKNGLMLTAIYPNYVEKKIQNKTNMTLEEISNLVSALPSMTQTNIPIGTADTTFYSYDKNDNLIEKKNKDQSVRFKYDQNNNCIAECYSSEFSETTCKYSIYKYDHQNKIISKVDSADVISGKHGILRNSSTYEFPYEYDGLGRITSDGQFRMTYNNTGQLIKLSGIGFKYENIMSYDKDGHLIKETEVDHHGTTSHFYHYSNNGLLEEEKTLNSFNKLIELKKYEYVFSK